MVARRAGKKKSEFVTRFLERNPEANYNAANEAWRRAGNKDGISTSLFYKAKSEVTASAAKRTTNGAHAALTASRPKAAAEPARKPAAPAPQGILTSAANGLESTPRSTGKVSGGPRKFDADVLDDLEAQMDRLIYRIMQIDGLDEVQQHLRRARRLLVRSHQG
jgi:hypothetical protein